MSDSDTRWEQVTRDIESARQDELELAQKRWEQNDVLAAFRFRSRGEGMALALQMLRRVGLPGDPRVRPTEPPSMAVYVRDGGHELLTPIPVSHPELARIDRIVNRPTISRVCGEPAGVPAPPPLEPGHDHVAFVKVHPAVSAITAADIDLTPPPRETDAPVRPFSPPSMQVWVLWKHRWTAHALEPAHPAMNRVDRVVGGQSGVRVLTGEPVPFAPDAAAPPLGEGDTHLALIWVHQAQSAIHAGQIDTWRSSHQVTASDTPPPDDGPPVRACKPPAMAVEVRWDDVWHRLDVAKAHDSRHRIDRVTVGETLGPRIVAGTEVEHGRVVGPPALRIGEVHLALIYVDQGSKMVLTGDIDATGGPGRG